MQTYFPLIYGNDPVAPNMGAAQPQGKAFTHSSTAVQSSDFPIEAKQVCFHSRSVSRVLLLFCWFGRIAEPDELQLESQLERVLYEKAELANRCAIR